MNQGLITLCHFVYEAHDVKSQWLLGFGMYPTIL